MSKMSYFTILVIWFISSLVPTWGQTMKKPDQTVDLIPLFDYWMRDVYVLNAPDGYYYLTGTTKTPGRDNIWDINDGVRLWRSKDLKNWEAMGLVWSFEEHGTWENQLLPVPDGCWETGRLYDENGRKLEKNRRAAWAPEIHFVNGKFYITLTINWGRNPSEPQAFYCTILLESESGKAEGPYKNVSDKPMSSWLDSSLFVDDDGAVYYVWFDGRIAKMNKELNGFLEQPRELIKEKFVPEPYTEGVYLFKHGGKYHLALTFWEKELADGGKGYFVSGKQLNYNCVISTSDSIYGPYVNRYTAVEGGGHNNIFVDKEGKIWSTYWGNPKASVKLPFVCRPGLVGLEWNGERFVDRPSSDK